MDAQENLTVVADTDPRPEPPDEPDAFACCGNDCGEACVWTIYQRAQKAYAEALEAWQIRQLERDDGA